MSMIYECPTCHAPQAAGRTACHVCGAEFDGTVPDDAIVPEAATISEPNAADDLPPAQETASPAAMPDPVQPQLQEVNPPPTQTPAFQPAPFQPPPAYAPPSYPANLPAPRAGFQIPKAVWIAVPVILVFVLGVVFWVNSLNQGSDTSSSPPPVTGPVTAPVSSAPVPVGSPLYLPGGQSISHDANPAVAKWLVGRWQARTTDYYVFNDDGTGLGGTITGKQPPVTFRWVLVQNQLILYSDKQQKMVVSKGAGDGSIFLRGDDGRYVEFARAKTAT